jgi:beta-mannosidase
MKLIDLTGKWKLTGKSSKLSAPADVPGDTHSALLAAGKIPDPYLADNETGLLWLGGEDWTYERSFEVSEEFLQESAVFLHCDSLDTMATLFLNDKKVAATKNMFVRYRFEVKKFLRAGTNRLRIEIASPEKAALAESKKLDHPLPHNQMPVQSQHRNLIRKNQCNAGWDWGPCLMVSGIYGKIYLGAVSLGRIEYVTTEQKHRASGVDVEISVEVESPDGGETRLEIELDGQKLSQPVSLKPGLNLLRRTVRIAKPKLWWPVGLGAQPLYDLTVSVADDTAKKRLGLRTVKLENKRDKIGRSMTIYVNDTPVFCKGANWIPTDALPQRQTRAVLEDLIGSAVAANMNMLRVWGGGLYEPDDFYDLCDEKGLLVWHDFMFSCALYPATDEFLDSVRQEARHQVKRLHDHPSLALWCGNNENIGALRWYPESIANRDLYITEYDRLNEGVLGDTVRKLAPSIPWWPSSPCGGPGDYENRWDLDGHGDMHYWNVWFNPAPIEDYLTIKPRFCSEFGFQSFPHLETIRTYAPPDQWNISSPIIEHHQRMPGGNSRIPQTFMRYFRFPEGFENILYLSQVQQALAMKIGIEYWRRLRPICMGALYWQLNDVWPVSSLSSIDYGGKWKLLQYVAKRFYAMQMISTATDKKKEQVEIWLTNDLLKAVSGTVRLRLVSFQGKILRALKFSARVPAASSVLVKKYAVKDFVAEATEGFIALEWQSGETLARNEHYFCEFKKMNLPKAKISLEARAVADDFAVTLRSDLPALWTTLNVESVRGEFDDNCFALLPGEPRILTFTPKEKVTLETFQKQLQIRHLRDTYA